MDNGWNSKISNQNINKILEKTGFDYKSLILDWNEFKDLQKAFLFAGVPDIELLTDHAIFSYILNFSIKNKVKKLIYTSSPSVIFNGCDMKGVDENTPYPNKYLWFQNEPDQ